MTTCITATQQLAAASPLLVPTEGNQWIAVHRPEPVQSVLATPRDVTNRAASGTIWHDDLQRGHFP